MCSSLSSLGPLDPVALWRRTAAVVVVAIAVSACGQESPERLIQSAKTRIAGADYRTATIELKNALQQNPKSTEARLLLGTTLLEQGDAVGADIEIRKALELGLPVAQANAALARAALMSGKAKLVIAQFGDAPSSTPSDTADLKATVAQAHVALREFDAAESALQLAFAADPGSPSALYVGAMLKAERNDLKAALELVDHALRRAPRFAEALALRGQLLAVKGDVDGAIAAHRDAIASKSHLMNAHTALVTLLISQGRLDEARKHIAALVTAAPKHAEPRFLEASLHYREKNLPAAQNAIEQHLAAAPDGVPGLVLAATIHQDLSLHARAEAFLQRVLALSPNDGHARRLLVAGRLRAGEPEKALEAVPAMLQASGQEPTALALAGQAYLATGRRDTAARHFEQAATLDPNDDRNRINLALSRLAKGDSEAAIKELERAAADRTDVSADLALIATHLRKGEVDKALAAVDGLDKKRPKQPLPHYVRGAVLLAKNDVPGARASFERAIAIDALHFPSVASLARLDLLDRKPQLAKQRFERVLAKQPNNAQALLALAEVERLSGANAEAVGALLVKAVAAAPSDTALRIVLIQHYVRNKDTRRAVTAAQEALAANPDRPELVEAAARAFVAAGASNNAIDMYTRLAQLQPKSALPPTRIAEIRIAQKDYAGAERSLRTALEIAPNSIEAQRRLIELEVARNRVPAAIAVARDVQKQRPRQAAGYVLEGDVHASRKDWPQALAAYANGLKQAPSSDLAIKAHAAQRLAGQHAEARKLAADWLDKHPSDRPFRVYLAQSSVGLKEYTVAVEHYKTLLNAQPDNVVWLNDLAWTLGQLKDPKAVEYAEKAAALAPQNAAVLDTLGMLLIDAGDTVRGVALLRKATSLAPERYSLRLNLATGLIRAGDKRAARKELESLASVGDKFAGQARVAELMKQL